MQSVCCSPAPPGKREWLTEDGTHALMPLTPVYSSMGRQWGAMCRTFEFFMLCLAIPRQEHAFLNG